MSWRQTPVSSDPTSERLRPGSLDVGEVRGRAWRVSPVSRVDDHPLRVAGAIEEQLFAAHKRPRWYVIFTPTSASRINQVEPFLVLLTERAPIRSQIH
jgi:hypothetical protein